MADINFPSNPSLNDTYSFGGKTWRYNGSVWLLETTPLSTRLNSAYNHANAAFNVANNASGGAGSNTTFEFSLQQESFVADGVANTFTLSTTPFNENYVLITINGVVQHKSAYSLSSANIQFNEVPENNDNIDVVIFYGTNSITGIADTSNVAFDSANSASSYANGAFTKANTADQKAVSAGDYANSAYGKANTANTLAQAAYDESNTRATISYVDSSIANLVNSAPVTLDTLNELAAALNNDPSFATTVATNIGIIGSYANSAYIQANTPSNTANSASSYSNSAYGQANTATTNAATADQKAVTSGDYANSSYSSSNTNSQNITITGGYANSAFARANISLNTQSGGSITGDVSVTGNLTVTGCTVSLIVTTLRTEDHIIDLGYGTTGTPTLNSGIRILRGDENPVQLRWVESDNYWEYTNDGSNYIKFGAYSDGEYANAAFDSANIADGKAVTSGDYANSGYSLANTANILAQAAFNAANNATDTWVRNAANSASSYANSAYIHANAAFAVANTGGGGGGSGTDDFARTTANAAFEVANTITALQNNSFYVNAFNDSFVADGVANTFTLTSSPINKNYTIVTFDGVVQHKSVYNVASSILSFSSAPVVNTEIDVVSFGRTPGNFSVNITHDNFTSNGSNTSFSLSATPENENYTLVTINGVVQHKEAYSVSGSTLTLSEAPLVNSSIDIVTFIGISAEYSNVSSNITPSVTETYNLGSADKKWKDLYLSGNTIFLGNTTISSSNNDLVLPANTKIGTGDTALPTAGGFSFRNKFINGNFDFWQRGTSQTSSGYGSADRWDNIHTGSTKTASRQSFTLGQTDVPRNPKYFMRHVVTSSAGSSNSVITRQKIEGVETLAGRTATLSFWAKADSNKNIALECIQYFGTGGSPSTVNVGIGSQIVNLTSSWIKYTKTFEVPSIAGKTIGTDNNSYVAFNFWFDAGSDWNSRTASLGQQSGTFDIAQVQLEEGLVATPFEQRPLGVELNLCERYYQIVPLNAFDGASQTFSAPFFMSTPMRATPTGTISGGSSVSVSSRVLEDVINKGGRFTIIGTAVNSYSIGASGLFDVEL